MADQKRKKRFFDVEIPSIKKSTNLIAYDLEELEGKSISYDLTRVLRGKSVILFLKIKIENNVATGIPVGVELVPSFLRRMVRKGTNYIEDSFLTECKDGTVRIKPFLVTRRKVSRAVRKALRQKAKEEIIELLKTKDSEAVIQELLRDQLQRNLALRLKKIYPLSFCDIKTFKVEKKN